MQAPPAVKAAIKGRLLLGAAQAGGGVRLVMTAEQRVPEMEPACNVIKVSRCQHRGEKCACAC